MEYHFSGTENFCFQVPEQLRCTRQVLRPGMAQVDVFDGAGDVNELAGAQRPTAADIDQPRFTKDMTMRWLCYLVNGTLKSAGCKSADKVGVLKARLKSLLGVAEDDDADLGAEAEGAIRRRWKNRARRASH